jgi:hypothetical protein
MAHAAVEITDESESTTKYNAPDDSFFFRYPNTLEPSPKPLKTHEFEVYLKSPTVKGFSAGVTMDRLKIRCE